MGSCIRVRRTGGETRRAGSPSLAFGADPLTVDELYRRNPLFKHIVDAEMKLYGPGRAGLDCSAVASRAVSQSETSERIRRIIALSGDNNYQLYEITGTDPSVCLIGFYSVSRQAFSTKNGNERKSGGKERTNDEKSRTMGSTANFISALAEQGALQGYSFLSEGYTGGAALSFQTVADKINALHKDIVPEITGKLNRVYAKYGLKPQGNDDLNLRSRQYHRFREANMLLQINSQERLLSHREIRQLDEIIGEAMNCLRRREQECFFPHIKEHVERGDSVIYLLRYCHLLSPVLSGALSAERISYASFVPKS
ncbi:MAG: hypothetical protein AB1668_01895 [Nanoarchaeota archaeon]